MSDVISLARRVGNLDVSPQFTNYSKVLIHVSDETVIEEGDDTGRTLEIDNPFGTQQIARNILNNLAGYQYQPYKASGAVLDPAAEIGDAANMRGVYGGIYTRSRTFTRLMKAGISAPHDEEINHEYRFETPQERSFKRQINDVRASLIIANDNIEAKVSRESPEGQTSFSWRLLADSHKWFANGREVMSVSESGLKVTGEVEATSGKIGDFNIKASAIWSGISSFGGTQSRGVYVGTDGIQLGQRFKVDTSGNVTATRLTVDTLYIGGSAVSAATLNTRANNGNSAYGWTSSNGSYCYNGTKSWNQATSSSSGVYPYYFRCTNLQASSIFIIGQGNLARGTISVPTSGKVTIGGTQYNVVFTNSTKNVWVY